MTTASDGPFRPDGATRPRLGRESGPIRADARAAIADRGVEAGVSVLLILAVVAGGATWQGTPGEGWLILVAVPLLAQALFLHIHQSPVRWGALLLVAATLALPVLQTVPWPGETPPWAPVHAAWQTDQARIFGVDPLKTLSLAPDASFRAFLALIPPAAVFLGVLLLEAEAQRRIVATICLAAVVSAVVGLLQAAFGDATNLSPLGPTAGQVKGFFSNRNHFAALMYIGIALTGAAFALSLRRMLGAPEPSRHAPALIAWSAAFLLLLVSCMLAQSRAGVVIGAGVVLALFVIVFGETARAAKGARRIFAVATVAAGLIAIQAGLWGVLERFRADPFEDGRIVVQATTLEAARDAAPWGTGIGTFRRVYEQREPLKTVISAWVNRAHNDWLEFRLEAGWPGSALLLAWVAWWLRSIRLRGPAGKAVDDPNLVLIRRLAFVAVVALAIHSLVDFPMRTNAIFCVVAALVAVTVGPRSRATAHDAAESPA